MVADGPLPGPSARSSPPQRGNVGETRGPPTPQSSCLCRNTGARAPRFSGCRTRSCGLRTFSVGRRERRWQCSHPTLRKQPDSITRPPKSSQVVQDALCFLEPPFPASAWAFMHPGSAAGQGQAAPAQSRLHGPPTPRRGGHTRAAGTFPRVSHADVGQESAEHQKRHDKENHVPLQSRQLLPLLRERRR